MKKRKAFSRNKITNDKYCVACGSAAFSREVILSDTDVFIAVNRCRNCGLFLSDITLAKKSRDVVQDYGGAFDRTIGAMRLSQSKIILMWLRQQKLTGESMLDIGCGSGQFLHASQSVGFDVRGVEPDDGAYARASRLLGAERVYHEEMGPNIVPDESFDVISTMDVLEHIPQSSVTGFARLIWKKLKPGGVWLIKVPTSEGLFFRVAHVVGRIPGLRFLARGPLKRLWQSDYHYPHTLYFNRDALMQFLQRNGFEIVDLRYIEEVPLGAIVPRLLMDDTIPKWNAYCMVPVFYVIHVLERMTGKTDGIVVFGKKNGPP